MIIRTKIKITGNALTQYGIIIVLIALALVPVFFFTGKYISGYFDSFYQSIKNNNNISVNNNLPVTDNDVINGTIKAGQLGGTSEKPALKCAGKVCSFDYGDFILNGIPADFQGLIQSSGTSGGTEKLISILESMAEQIKDTDPTAYTKLIKLANLGHIMGDLQKQTEAKINECKANNDPKTCLKNWLDKPIKDNYTLPSNLSSNLPNFVSETNKWGWSTNCFIQYSYPGSTNSYPISASKGITNDSIFPGFGVKNSYEDISKDLNIPQNIRDVTTELYRNLNDIGQNFYASSFSSTNDLNNLALINYDPVDGKNLGYLYFKDTTLEDVTNPKSALLSHGDSYLICKKGRNKDDGSKCN